jgi:hypothetical protein
MGIMDDAKDAAQSTGEKVGEWVDDTKERVEDSVEDVAADVEANAKIRKANAEAEIAERERDATHAKNEYKEKLRED